MDSPDESGILLSDEMQYQIVEKKSFSPPIIPNTK